MRSEVADVTGIVKYIGNSVFSAPKRRETLSTPPPPTHPSASYSNAYASNNPRNTCGILLGSSQFPVPFSFLKWRIVTILTNKLPFLVEVVIFC